MSKKTFDSLTKAQQAVIIKSGKKAEKFTYEGAKKADEKLVATFKKAGDRKSTRLNSSHIPLSRMPSSA